MRALAGEELLAMLRAGAEPGGPVIVVAPGGAPPTPADVARVAALPSVLVGTEPAPAWLPVLDAVAGAEDPGGTALVVDAAQAQPDAAVALALLLRTAPASVAQGLVNESATYSMLQAGAGFRRWLATRPAPRQRAEPDRAVLVERDGDRLVLTLHRPHVRNALDPRLRDELLDGLAVALAEPTLQVELRGDGPAFCAGGDLDTFGTFVDPAHAHRVRLERSIGRVLDELRDRATAHLHGACYGSGIELPAFCGRVVADPGTRIALPELALGLIPGAGGTVSLPRRIGRHRTLWLALTGAPVDAATALEWGLVDELG